MDRRIAPLLIRGVDSVGSTGRWMLKFESLIEAVVYSATPATPATPEFCLLPPSSLLARIQFDIADLESIQLRKLRK